MDNAICLFFIKFRGNLDRGGGIPQTSLETVMDTIFHDFDRPEVYKRFNQLINEGYLKINHVNGNELLKMIYVTEKGRTYFNL